MLQVKNHLAKVSLTCMLLTASILHGQNYTYRKYLEDGDIAGTIKNSFTKDTIQKYIGQFQDRLGYQYYLYQSVLKNSENKIVSIKYLDTAFSKGLNYLCLKPLMKQLFGDSVISKSYELNYLKSYNLKLMQSLDSLKEQDQKYRSLSSLARKRQQRSDSIMALWVLTDSLNVIFLKTLIKNDGYPTAKKIGYDFCRHDRSDPELIIQHLGEKQRDFQISLLKQLVELCLKNEEDWQKIHGLQFNLHFRFSHSYSEFTFIYFKKNTLDVESSLYSLTIMAGHLASPFKTMYIKCSSERDFKTLKASLLELNWATPFPPHSLEDCAKFGIAPLKKIVADQIVFVKDKSVPSGKVYYKIEY